MIPKSWYLTLGNMGVDEAKLREDNNPASEYADAGIDHCLSVHGDFEIVPECDVCLNLAEKMLRTFQGGATVKELHAKVTRMPAEMVEEKTRKIVNNLYKRVRLREGHLE